MPPKFFKTAAEFRKWLEKNHAKATELLVRYYKTKSGKPSMTWSESVDQALCFGWIDGVRRSINDESYQIRFTPRRSGSTWSAVNLKKIATLKKAGLMHKAGLAIHEKRDAKKEKTASYERKQLATLPAVYEKKFKANKRAWTFFQEQAPWYRKVTTHWVMSAKKEETQLRRLAQLIEDSEQGRKIKQVDIGKKK